MLSFSVSPVLCPVHRGRVSVGYKVRVGRWVSGRVMVGYKIRVGEGKDVVLLRNTPKANTLLPASLPYLPTVLSHRDPGLTWHHLTPALS